jgi:transposase-like protein
MSEHLKCVNQSEKPKGSTASSTTQLKWLTKKNAQMAPRIPQKFKNALQQLRSLPQYFAECPY